ncbi:MAG: hypothetical protein HQL87_00870 [Magnetococcales bacterium]|nr:hypothetical protein [Magnetococcales bacterium]
MGLIGICQTIRQAMAHWTEEIRAARQKGHPMARWEDDPNGNFLMDDQKTVELLIHTFDGKPPVCLSLGQPLLPELGTGVEVFWP